jgi:hypothetical protein
MTEPTGTPAPSPGLLARAIGMITSPGDTFKRIVDNPRPMGILLLVCLVLTVATTLPSMTEAGRRAAVEQGVRQVEAVTGQAPTAEMYAQIETQTKYGVYFAPIGIFIFVPIVTLFFTALYWAIFNTALGGTASFKQVLTVVAHSQVIGALGAAVGAPIMMMAGKAPTVAGPFNLGALAPFLEPGTFLAKYLSSISFFTIWGIAVTGIGLAVLYRRKGSSVAITLILVYLVIWAGIISVFGRFFPS